MPKKPAVKRAPPRSAPPRTAQPQLGRSTIAPELMKAERRASFGLPTGKTAAGDYLVELNLRFAGGVEAAELKLLRLFKEVVPKGPTPVRIGKSYFACRLSILQVVELVARDERREAKPEPGKQRARPATGQNLPRERAIHRVWPDFPVKPLLDESVATVKADAALRAFAASGDGITWAVLDSGIDRTHPHFGLDESSGHTLLAPEVRDLHRNFQDQTLGDPDDPANAAVRDALIADHRDGALQDPFGHGTHVAGIIAGGFPTGDPKEPPAVELRVFATAFTPSAGGEGHDSTVEERTRSVRPADLHGVAPLCKLVSLRVLDANGGGRSSDVIRALDYVRERLNRDPRMARVHGVNLSVGYEFDAEMYACGQSPLCIEVDRLVQTGVVVVAAAGNTGYGTVLAKERTTVGGLTQTINDPGNAALAVTVGATHRDSPYTYGVSYFSSKGPTGDGRLKPDLVAPGERITSCAAGALRGRIPGLPPPAAANPPATPAPAAPAAPTPKNAKGAKGAVAAKNAPAPQETKSPARAAVYLDLSGTSMAAPHVSGAIAAFLSIRREFIGKPLEVKRIFLDSASPLGRERYFEGHGLVDLMRAIQSV